MLNTQHITPNSKRWDDSDIPGGGTEQIKRPAHMVESDPHQRKDPNPHQPSVGNYLRTRKCDKWQNYYLLNNMILSVLPHRNIVNFLQ